MVRHYIKWSQDFTKTVFSHLFDQSQGLYLEICKIVNYIIEDVITNVIVQSKPNVVRVFLHNPGVLRMSEWARNHFIDVYLDKKFNVNLDRNIYTMLDFDGAPCNQQRNYNSDECLLEKLTNESMEKIGCTTPFGISTDNVCKNESIGKEALEIFDEYKDDGRSNKSLSCLKPCSYMTFKLSNIDEKSMDGKTYGKLKLIFNGLVHETVSYYSYDGLSFIAELGGYIGLFAGVSVYQTADLIDFIMRKYE